MEEEYPMAMVRALAKILIIPGLNGSGLEHWQTLGVKERIDYLRIEQADWRNPDPSTGFRGSTTLLPEFLVPSFSQRTALVALLSGLGARSAVAQPMAVSVPCWLRPVTRSRKARSRGLDVSA